MWDRLVEMARRKGPIARSHFRAMTIETDARVNSKDFDSLAAAQRYADDAASETGDDTPIAVVLDDRFEVIYQGKPYYSKGDR